MKLKKKELADLTSLAYTQGWQACLAAVRESLRQVTNNEVATTDHFIMEYVFRIVELASNPHRFLIHVEDPKIGPARRCGVCGRESNHVLHIRTKATTKTQVNEPETVSKSPE